MGNSTCQEEGPGASQPSGPELIMDMSQALRDKRCVVEQRISFWEGHEVCGVLVATPPSVELHRLNHWSAKEVPGAEHHFLKR